MHNAVISSRANAFCERFGVELPILLAPMAGACPVPLSAALANVGSMGAMGAVLSTPEQIGQWMGAFRTQSQGPAQVNLWVPDPAPVRDVAAEAATRDFLGKWGPQVPAAAGDAGPADFDAQFEALIQARPAVASTIMGVLSAAQVQRLRAANIAWFACVTTLDEALQAQAAGADAVIAQGMEAGGHRGAFDAAKAELQMSGLFALLPRLADHLQVPVIAAGGIADGRGVAAALLLGASAVQVGTAFLAADESDIPQAWRLALAESEPEGTRVTRTFSGRLGRALNTAYVRAAEAAEAPLPQPYPVQRGLTAGMRREANAADQLDAMQAWAGQSAWLARRAPAADIIRTMWAQAQVLL
ncbi:MAG: NAD(P)H-dependent flavin oxidoreductase [Stenotrophomonas sp.]|uniref:NAD(P)H-dependent flavin oxidoreductase n=1 Tax=Stenotrophomonas sp. TaxID=69392 RepID=UPI003D6D6ED1